MKKVLVLFSALILSLPALAGDDKPIAVDQLPAPAKTFIDQFFKDAKVSLSTVDKEFLDTTYEVFFADGSKVQFDKNGKWKEIDCQYGRVPQGAIPVEIRKYVAANHPRAFVREIDRDKRDYEVKLDNGLELKFDLQGRLIGIDN